MARLAAPLALLGGALLGSAFSIQAAWPAVFPAVAALVLSLESAPTRREAMFRGAMFGWTGYVGGFFWLQPALASFWTGRIALSWCVWLAWGCWVSLRFVAIAWGYRTLRNRRSGILISLTVSWLTVECLYPAVFPFYLANPLIDCTTLAQATALGGPLLLSAWVCATSIVCAEGVLWLERRRPIARLEWSVWLIASLVLYGYGIASIRAVEERVDAAPSITVGVVQANIDVMDKRTERVLSHRRYLRQSMALKAETRLDLLIWPETSYLYALPRKLPTSGAAVLNDLQIPLLFGGVRKDDRARKFNSALLLDADGVIRSAYDKRFLIPFAEFVPWADRFRGWAEAAPTLSHFHAGDALTALQLGNWRIATPICYETIRPEYVRQLVRHTKAHLIVSLSNDGWFGDSPEPRVHLALARFRAVEHRRYLVRATNTGISAVVDPLGRIAEQTDIFEAASLAHEVRMLDEATVYSMVGDWPGYLAALVWLVLLITRRTKS